jgi:hypothetical protein
MPMWLASIAPTFPSPETIWITPKLLLVRSDRLRHATLHQIKSPNPKTPTGLFSLPL